MWLFSSLCERNVLSNLMGLCPVTRCNCISTSKAGRHFSACFVSSPASLAFFLSANFLLLIKAQRVVARVGEKKARDRLLLIHCVDRITTNWFLSNTCRKQTIYIYLSGYTTLSCTRLFHSRTSCLLPELKVASEYSLNICIVSAEYVM